VGLVGVGSVNELQCSKAIKPSVKLFLELRGTVALLLTVPESFIQSQLFQTALGVLREPSCERLFTACAHR